MFEYPETAFNTKSAQAVVPFLMETLKPFSVIDVGCGIGTWLKVFEQHGVKDFFGIDSESMDVDRLLIDKKKYFGYDLTRALHLNRKYDLVVSLEIAEHLPAESARTFVETLTGLGDTILFSAAIPGQGGVDHLNEQPFSFWENLFGERGFKFYDVLRNRFWNDDRVEWWYRQNMFIVSKKRIKIDAPPAHINVFVHPELYKEVLQDRNKIKEGRYQLKEYWKIMQKKFYNLLKSI